MFDKSDVLPPGPLDNREIEKLLIIKEDDYLESEAFETNKDFYNVSKPLFYFFQSTYGGGPAIINNALFKEYVLD